ncbi:MAG TPA: transcriptional regulator, partial [Caulobacteraceae bacterium]|nr:transcriptional regulator [Caulobacteraceae bacterium]
MVQINNSYLLGLYGVSSDMIGALSTGVSTAAAKPKDPTPPWSSSSTAPRANELVERALRGRSFIDLTGAQVDVKGASQDYRKLFALYQGLNTLHALASRMDTKGVSTFEQSQIERRFAAGMGQVGDFIGDLKLDNMDMARGTAAAVLKSSVGMKRPATDYVGAVIHEGASTDPVAAYQGNVQFNVRVQKSTTLSTGQVIVVGGPIDVSIDLNDMGTTPRTLANVNTFINDRLAAANIQTRFATERTPGQARTVTVGDKTVTLPATQDRFALKIKGSAMESVTFSTTSNADAVYVVQQANTGDAAKQQLLKFQSNDPAAGTPSAAQVRVGETHWADGRAFAMDMASAVETARAVQTGADGSVYVLADVDGTIAGQDIKGEQDVALLKYDSSGQLVFARTLGAAETASGYALAVNADGKVAVAGAVTGALDRGDDGLDGDKSDG